MREITHPCLGTSIQGRQEALGRPHGVGHTCALHRLDDLLALGVAVDLADRLGPVCALDIVLRLGP